MDLCSFLCLFQVERLEEGNPGKLKVTGKYNDGTEFVDEFNTVSGSDSFTIFGLWVLGLAVCQINESNCKFMSPEHYFK